MTTPCPAKAASPWISTGMPVVRSTIVVQPLLGANAAFHDRVDDLQVAGVGRNRKVHRAAGGRGNVRREAKVVLHVAIAAERIGKVVVLEFVEDFLERLAEDIGEYVQAAAMGHADDQFLGAEPRRLLHQRIEHGNQRFAAFERESLLSHELRVQEFLEEFGLMQRTQDAVLLAIGEGGAIADRFHAVGEPAAGIERIDVHVLDAERAAISFAQGRHQVARGELVRRGRRTSKHR